MSECTGLSSRLLQNLSSTSPLEAVLKTGASEFGHSLYLIDCTGKILGFALPPVLSAASKSRNHQNRKSMTGMSLNTEEHVWQSFCSRGCIDLNTCQAIFSESDDQCHEESDNKPGWTPMKNCRIRNFSLTVCSLKTGGKACACLAVHIPFDRLKSSEIDQLNTICRTLMLLLGHSMRTDSRNPKELLLSDLLESKPVSRLAVAERCKIVGLKPAADFFLMTVCNSQNITNKPVFDAAVRKLNGILSNFVYVIHNNRLVVLLCGIIPDRTWAASCGLSEFLAKYSLTAAVSFPFEHIYEIHQAYIQTLQALDEGLAVDYSDNLYFYQDYLPYHALSYVKNPKDFCHPCIGQLMTEDARHKTEYTKTLYYYIINFRNQKNAAQEMNIHYNTMKYRLKKIQALIDFSLEDHDEFLLLYLSFKLMKLNGHIF